MSDECVCLCYGVETGGSSFGQEAAKKLLFQSSMLVQTKSCRVGRSRGCRRRHFARSMLHNRLASVVVAMFAVQGSTFRWGQFRTDQRRHLRDFCGRTDLGTSTGFRGSSHLRQNMFAVRDIGLQIVNGLLQEGDKTLFAIAGEFRMTPIAFATEISKSNELEVQISTSFFSLHTK